MVWLDAEDQPNLWVSGLSVDASTLPVLVTRPRQSRRLVDSTASSSMQPDLGTSIARARPPCQRLSCRHPIFAMQIDKLPTAVQDREVRQRLGRDRV